MSNDVSGHGTDTEEINDPTGAAADPVVGAIKIGDKIGDYVIVRKLGEGGMGVVFEARALVTDYPVAIKMLYGSSAYAPEITGRFKREASAANRIGHPDFVKAISFGDHGGRPYFTMEYLNGISLGDELRDARMAVGRACRILVKIADAMQAAHDFGVVHRDLKPDNVFLLAGDAIKILDLGIAKFVDDSPTLAARTKSGLAMGTPYTMSPEQARGLKIDHRSDVYALGVIAYRIFANYWPHQEGSFAEILGGHMFTEPVNLRVAAPWIPEELADIVHKAMAKDLAARFQQMRDLSAALAPLADVPMPLPANLPTVRVDLKSPTTHSASNGEKMRPPQQAPARTNIWGVIGAIAVVLGGAAGGGAFFWKRSKTAPAQAETTQTTTTLPTKPNAAEAPPVVLGRVLVSTAPTGASVTLDGRVKGKTPLIVSGKPGDTVQVHLSLDGYEERVVPVLVAEDDRKAEFNLTEVRTKPTSAPTTSKPSASKSKVKARGDRPPDPFAGD